MAVFQKTRLCRFFRRGRCLRGPDCTFAHGRDQLRAPPNFTKTRMCQDFLASGSCRSGGACTFAHHREELRRASGVFGGEVASGSSPNERATAGVNVAGSDAQAVRRYYQALHDLQMQLQALNETVRVLDKQHDASAGAPAKRREKDPCPPRGSESDDELSHPMDFSRQSTEKGGASPQSFGGLSFSRQTTYDNCNLNAAQQSFTWQSSAAHDEGVGNMLKVVPLGYSFQHGILEQLTAMTDKIPKGGAPLASNIKAPTDSEMPEGFKVTVKNTFIHVETVSVNVPRGALRRARSVPEVSRPAP